MGLAKLPGGGRTQQSEASKHLNQGYAAAFLAVFCCTIIRIPLQAILETRAPYAFYIPAVAFCAWRFGLRSALACLTIGASLGTYLFVTPITAIVNKPELASLLIFLASSLSVAFMGGENRSAHWELKKAREKLRAANVELEGRVAERTAALVEKNEELNSFTYTMAHDLRSAIRSIVVNARLLIDDEGEGLGAEGREKTMRLYSAAMRLSSFVDDLLKYARNGNKAPARAATDLSELFESEAREALDALGGVPYRLSVQKGLIQDCDPSLVSLAFRNLAENSGKYRSEGAVVELEFGETTFEGASVLFVRDNGIGFEADFSEKIFQPFERLHRYADIPGTGIGLSNVKRAVERHGGRIWAESEPGKGATFYFTLAPIQELSPLALAA